MGCKYSVPGSIDQQLRSSLHDNDASASPSVTSSSAAVTAGPAPPMSSGGNHAEHRLEVAFRTKRQNVFSSGVAKELSDPSYRVKHVPKAEAEKTLIRKCHRILFIVTSQIFPVLTSYLYSIADCVYLCLCVSRLCAESYLCVFCPC
jgi:hypothetical protein